VILKNKHSIITNSGFESQKIIIVYNIIYKLYEAAPSARLYIMINRSVFSGSKLRPSFIIYAFLILLLLLRKIKTERNYYNIIENTISHVRTHICVTANASQTHTYAHTREQVHIFRNVWFIKCYEKKIYNKKMRENKPADSIDDDSAMMYYKETRRAQQYVSLYNCHIGTSVYVIRNVHLFYTRRVSKKSTSEKICCWMSDKIE